MKEFLPTSLPERWQKRPLEDVVLRMSNGITKRQTKDGNGLPVSRIESISHGVVDMTRVGYLSGLSSSEVENYRLKAGDILFSHINSDLHLGKTAVFSLDSDTLLHGMNLLLIRVDSKKALPAFLHWLFNFYRVGGLFMSIAQHAVNQSSINQAKLKQLPVILPPLPEQRRIVAEIEKQFTRLEAGVAALRRVQANLKRYRAAVLKAACEGRLVPTEAARRRTADDADGADKKLRKSASSAKSAVNSSGYETGAQLLARILTERRQNWQGRGQYKEPAVPDTAKLSSLPEGWTWARLEQLGVTYGGLTKNPKRTKLAKQLPYLRVANVYANELRLDDIEYIGVADSELAKLLVRAGDLLIVEGNGSKDQIGRLAIWDGSIDSCVHQNHLIKVRPVEPRMPKWILHWLQSPGGRQFVELVASSTSGLFTLSVNKVGNLLIPLPPLAEQTRIVAEVERRLSVVEELESVVAANLQRAVRLRQSILQKAFTGQLV